MADTTALRTCCIVLGMHRSGTSCLTRILHAAGLHLGKDLSLARQESNLGGHWEPLQAVEINDRILAHSGGTWNRPPAQIATNEALDRDLAQFHESLATAPVYGWKDPRTTLTLPAWLPHLGDFMLVGCFRHPCQVAQSLAVREKRPADEALALWATYNERLLSYAEKRLPIVWVPYDDNRVQYAQCVQRLCARLRLNFSESLLDLRNDFMQHHRAEPPIADPSHRRTYERLLEHFCDQAGSWSTLPQTVSAPAVIDPVHGLVELQRQLEALAEAFEGTNSARQRESHERLELAHVVQQLARVVDEHRSAHERQLLEMRDELHHSLATAATSLHDLTLQIRQVQDPIETLRLIRLARWLKELKRRVGSLCSRFPLRRAA